MSKTRQTPSIIVPARLSLLTIYNPAFGDSDETAYEQIFYYFSASENDGAQQSSAVRHDKSAPEHATGGSQQQEEVKQNARLRKVGLARGMVEFANNFSNGVAVDSVETDRTRYVLHELEKGWWVLACIDLTKISTGSTSAPSTTTKQEKSDEVEYSAREVASARLLISQLVRAHSIFMLHHVSKLDEILVNLGRKAFSLLLETYWNKFAQSWDVLLHGNPASDVYNGIKLAGGGELGIGVGEEEWGSGEREVLEDFVHRTEGLIDLVVSRFGQPPPDTNTTKRNEKSNSGSLRNLEAWIGTGLDPEVADGVIFSGIGALKRCSLASISAWIEAIFKDGHAAYGIVDPFAPPKQRRRKKKQTKNVESQDARLAVPQPTSYQRRSSRQNGPDLRRTAIERSVSPPGIPPPLVTAAERSLDKALGNLDNKNENQTPSAGTSKKPPPQPEDDQSYFDTKTMMNVLKLGYGSSWTLSSKGFEEPEPAKNESKEEAPAAEETPSTALTIVEPTPEVSEDEADLESSFVQRLEESKGRFLIGLTGDLENAEFEADVQEDQNPPTKPSEKSTKGYHLIERTLTVSLNQPQSTNSNNPPTHSKLRIAVYVYQPFIFLFLFAPSTSSLNSPKFYRSIHHQLGPLQKPLLRSTEPARIREHLSHHLDTATVEKATGLYDLIYDPTKLTVRSSIPNIPVPGSMAAEGLLNRGSSGSEVNSTRTVSGAWYTLGIPVSTSNIGVSSSGGSSLAEQSRNRSQPRTSSWTRIESLNVHTQILQIWESVRPRPTSTSTTAISESRRRDKMTADIERTVKTSRGWWIMWMRVPVSEESADHPPSLSSSVLREGKAGGADENEKENDGDRNTHGLEKEAFLVRKATDAPGGSSSSASRSASSGKWLLREGGREVSGSSGGAGGSEGGTGAATTARGVVEGVGIDARRWVEGVGRLG